MPTFGKLRKGRGLGDVITSDQLNDDIKALDKYDRASKLADQQRQHLKACGFRICIYFLIVEANAVHSECKLKSSRIRN